jgi:hypothetical protein
MKLSSTVTTLVVYLYTVLLLGSVHSNKIAEIAKDPSLDIVHPSLSLPTRLVTLQAHVAVANIGRDSLTAKETRFMGNAMVSAYEFLLVDDRSVHMVDAQMLSKSPSKETNGAPNLRGLVLAKPPPPAPPKRSPSPPQRYYGTFYRYDYRLFFDPSRCNCGNFWNRRGRQLGTFTLTKSQSAEMATKFCQILRSGRYPVFKKVRACQVIPFE